MADEREEEEQQEGYHKVDKRIGREAEAPTDEPVAEPAEPTDEPTDEPVAEPAEEPAAETAPEEPRRPAGPPAGEEEAAEAGDDGAADAPPEEAIQIDMHGILRMMFGMCVEQAWVHLGLQLAPGAKETKMDLPQARLAIDTIAYVQQALRDNLQDAEKREVEQLLATLRMNYLQRT